MDILQPGKWRRRKSPQEWFSGLEVRGRLYAAFFGISFFVVLAAAVSIYSFLRVDRALVGITQDSVPLAIASLDLSRQAERIVAAAPALLSVTSTDDRAALFSSLNRDVDGLSSLLRQLAGHEIEAQQTASISRAVQQLRQTLDALNRLVIARISVTAQRKDQLEASLDAGAQLRAALERARKQAAIHVQNIRSSARPGSADDGSLERRSLDLVEATEDYQQLGSAQSELSLLMAKLTRMASVEDPRELPNLSLQAAWSLDKIRQSILPNNSASSPTDELLDRLTGLVDGPKSLSRTRLIELQLFAAGEQSLGENAGLSARFGAAVDRLVDAAEANILAANGDVLSTHRITSWILLSVVGLTLASSFLIVWLYVQRNVIARLTGLSDSMRAIAEGDLDVPLPAPGHDEIGRMAEALAVFRNTAVEVKRSNIREIREARRRLDDAVESIQEGLALFDADDRLVLQNSRYGELLYGGEEMPELGMTYEAILRRALDRNRIVDAVSHADREAWIAQRLAQHREPTASHEQQRSTGRRIRINERKTADGGTVATYSDITALHERQVRLEEMDRLKSQFLSSVSHELRTPLTSVRGFAKLILKDFERHFLPMAQPDVKLLARADRIRENIGIVESEGERLTRLINEVLDLSKIESGIMQWHDTLFPIRTLLGTAFKAASGQFSEKPDLRPVLELPEELPQIRADYDRIFQVVVNLINNAAKFTPVGEVRLSAREAGDWIEIAVSDTGPGIPPEDAEKVFDRFHQVMTPDTLADKPTGTGLGLSICKQIVEHYGGRIWASSRTGQGALFTFRLPLAGRDEDVGLAHDFPTAGRPDAVKGAHILVVDDEPSLRRYLGQLLAEDGYEVTVCSNGEEALAQARRHRPNLITMDLNMPKLDGRAAIAALRNDPSLHDIPIIVVSAVAGPEEPTGDVTLAKPIDEEKLLAGVRLLLGDAADPDDALLDGARDYLLVDLPEAATSFLHPSPLRPRIARCCLHELDGRLAAGFAGTLVLPAEALDRLNLPEILATSHVFGVLLESSRAAAAEASASSGVNA
ncbi:MAG: PAS-domain containing protein [Rhizobiaceae bacterium]|nr:PAS-domain containing protein [Rhizobiaceae bacterium]